MFGLGILGLAIYAYTIYEVVTSRFFNETDKIIWILIVIFLPVLGTILWFLVGRGKRIQ
ncbi:PLDc N-terminal domain-containing protein [Algoriphagus sp. CAU 1675]|uniref:PLDc N-terminal domain-containing protein n=1 Tax=Algoriphagus sp. CAU 1675 TaxID=3032597 RepID=UPI0023DBC7D6|nr:PLDc N-terminal domain-containing protein [Algoriphagus sp. CAU 1675]MDF2156518.1 PLDc N-terminal domain-containing protein [Algoriphagus sp. CAU 1675]